VFQDEDEVDQGTMVRAGTGDLGTVRAAGSLVGSLSSGTARTMIAHEDEDTGTMRSQLGTMVINSDDEEDEEAGTMKRKLGSLRGFGSPSLFWVPAGSEPRPSESRFRGRAGPS